METNSAEMFKLRGESVSILKLVSTYDMDNSAYIQEDMTGHCIF